MGINKTENKARLDFYMNRAFANANAVHTVAVKGDGIDRGTTGDSFEAMWKFTLGLIVKVAGQGRIDARKAGNSIEFKTACGELAKMNKQGKWVEFTARDYVFYSPDYEPGDDVTEVTYFLHRADFFKALDECGLIRTKRSSYAVAHGLDCDRKAIQSFKNSRTKYHLLLDTLEAYNLTFEGWKQEVGL